MRKLLMLGIGTLMCFQLAAQMSDILSVRRKNGITLRSFTAGSPIHFQTNNDSYVEGTIHHIRHDSLFVIVYDIRTVLSRFGVTVVDTLSRAVYGFHYKDIERIKVFNYRRFVRGKTGKLLMFGGAGYFALNVINTGLSGDQVNSKNNVRNLAIAAGAFGLGWVIKKYFTVNRFSRKKHKIVYIKLH